MRFSLFLVIFMAMSATFPRLMAQKLPPTLDAYIENGMEEWNLPGLAITVVQDGEPILVKGYGVKEAGKEKPVDENTLFAIGSATKAFTATALGILVDREKLHWNTHVHEIAPRLKFSDPWVTQEIRVSDLPSNHSGLSAISESLWYGSGLERQEILDRLQYVPFSEGFRYQYQYRNVMFLLGGQLIPLVTDGTSWDTFVAEEIFDPLGMTRTSPTDKGIEQESNVARPHIIDYEGNPIPMPYRDMQNIGPAGSIISCAKDLVPWIKVHLGQSPKKPIVAPATLRYLHTSQTPMWGFNAEGELRNSPSSLHSYCLGWVTESYRGERLVWHNGNIDGMSAWVALAPDLGLGVGILTNLDDCELRKAIFYHILDHCIDHPGEDLDPQLLARFRKTIATRDEAEQEWQKLAAAPLESALPLESYTGQYHSDLLGTATITVKEGKLLYERTPQQMLELVVKEAGGNAFLGRHTNPNEDLRTGKVQVTFDVEDSQPQTLEDASEGIPILFKKLR